MAAVHKKLKFKILLKLMLYHYYYYKSLQPLKTIIFKNENFTYNF